MDQLQWCHPVGSEMGSLEDRSPLDFERTVLKQLQQEVAEEAVRARTENSRAANDMAREARSQKAALEQQNDLVRQQLHQLEYEKANLKALQQATVEDAEQMRYGMEHGRAALERTVGEERRALEAERRALDAERTALRKQVAEEENRYKTENTHFVTEAMLAIEEQRLELEAAHRELKNERQELHREAAQNFEQCRQEVLTDAREQQLKLEQAWKQVEQERSAVQELWRQAKHDSEIAGAERVKRVALVEEVFTG